MTIQVGAGMTNLNGAQQVCAAEQALFVAGGVRPGGWETRTSWTVASRVFDVPELEVFAHARLVGILSSAVLAWGVGSLG